MDAFFASVEQRDNPLLRGKPVAVGGNSNRSVVAAASYEARKFGVKSAMPVVMAKARCPHLIMVNANGKAYREASNQILAIFREYTELVEPLSLDEAFLDVTFQKKGVQSATLLASEIRELIFKKTGLTASAGISYNKFLAKIASDVNKPNGQFVIPPHEALAFLENLKIDRFFGIGKASAEKFNKLGIFTGADLKKYEKEALIGWFGKSGEYYYNIVRGIDNRHVEPFRERKSVGAEKTFELDISDSAELKKRLSLCIDRMMKVVDKKEIKGKTLTLKIKYADFETISRSYTIDIFTDNRVIIENNIFDLFEKEWPLPKPVRLLGVSLSNFEPENFQAKQMDFNF